MRLHAVSSVALVVFCEETVLPITLTSGPHMPCVLEMAAGRGELVEHDG